MLVASLVDGVLLVVDSGRTRRGPVQLAVQMLQQAQPELLGAVLNKVAPKGRGEYGAYHDYYQYAEPVPNGDGSGPGFISRSWARLRFRKSGASNSADGHAHAAQPTVQDAKAGRD